MITAAETCDFINEVVCKPANVKELFEFGNFAGTQISRTEVLILLAAIIPVVVVFFGLRKKSIVPGKLQSAVESIFTFVKDEIALGVIELVSVLLVRPFSLAVRLFANLVAGHVMLSLLLASAYFFLVQPGGADYILSKAPIGLAWFTLGLGIYGFELIVSILQAYIFTLLSAVYIQTSLHPEH